MPSEKELLSRWKTAMDAYTKVDLELRAYCDERGLIVSRCDHCTAPVLVSPEEPESKTNVLRWHFCSDDCRQKYWQENKQ